MKDNIKYYYNLLDIDCFEKKDVYYFKSGNRLFSFEKVENIEKSKRIFSILQKFDYVRDYKVVFNIYGDIFTQINDEWYVLFLHFNEQYNLLNALLHPINVTGVTSFDISFSWSYLWSKKIDYYEYQFKHISDIYPLVLESFNYYIGLAENAISYFSYNLHSLESFNLFLCHGRISDSNYFNPLNVIIDYYPRDIAEYFKFLFFSNQYKSFSFVSFFKVLKFTYNDYILLFSRLLFPSYYFDVYDDIIREKSRECELSRIIALSNEYYKFLQEVYQAIFPFARIPSIDWIKK